MAKGDDALAALIAAPLTAFEGREVRKAAIEVRGVGGGLNEAVSFEPVEWHKGRRVAILLDCYVDDITFATIKAKGEDTGADTRVHILRLHDEGVTFMDPAEAVEYFRAQRERIQILREKAQGIHRLELGDGDGDGAGAEDGGGE